MGHNAGFWICTKCGLEISSLFGEIELEEEEAEINCPRCGEAHILFLDVNVSIKSISHVDESIPDDWEKGTFKMATGVGSEEYPCYKIPGIQGLVINKSNLSPRWKISQESSGYATPNSYRTAREAGKRIKNYLADLDWTVPRETIKYDPRYKEALYRE